MNRYILFIITCIAFICGCNDHYFHDTGLANGKHDCTIWEYMQNDKENWDSTLLIIKRAGLESLFDGSDSEHKEITFFGPTNIAVMQFLFKTVDDRNQMLYRSVDEIPVELCRQMILSHVIKGRKMKNTFEYENVGTLTGGTIDKNLLGNDLRIYRTKSSYMDIPDIGPEDLFIHSLKYGHIVYISTSNLEMTNGIVHALSNTYQITEL